MKRLYILTLCTVCISIGIFFLKKKAPTTIAAGKGLVVPKEWLCNNKDPMTPQADRRPADQTFLTYPEWFLVFSPEEQAQYFKQHTATTFPYISHTAQIWESYAIVTDQIKDNFPWNSGYHFMIKVIGTSASAEYLIKAWYETLIGRLTDTQEPITEEDKFNAQYTQDYVDFIKDHPWYEFDFKSRFKTLSGTSIWGDHLLRKLERKYILSSELIVKTVYGKLIGLGTKQVYEEALNTTSVVLNNNEIKSLPRYDKFNKAITDLAAEGNTFKEIAGNTSAILVTILLPEKKEIVIPNTQTIFTQPVSSLPQTRRIALVTPVADLAALLLHLQQEHIVVEHVFDY